MTTTQDLSILAMISSASIVVQLVILLLLVVSFMSNSLTRHWRGYARARGLPLIEDLERGLGAVRHLVDYADFRRRRILHFLRDFT